MHESKDDWKRTIVRNILQNGKNIVFNYLTNVILKSLII